MGLFNRTPRPRSDSELQELRDGAKALRASARRNQHDPAKADREARAAARNEADIQAELDRRRRR